MLKQYRTQAGDTIIEVMIALAIVGAVIGTSYAISARSLRTGRQAQERTEALKLVESQIELLKAAAPAQKATLFSSPAGNFCVTTSPAGVVVAQNSPPPADPFADPLVVQVGSAGPGYAADCALGDSKRYLMSIQRVDEPAVAPAPVTSVFVIRARWQKVGGGNDEVLVSYRLHKGLY